MEASLLFNVSTLLGEPVGGTRAFELHDEPARVPGEDYERAVNGEVRLLRTGRGVLVRAQITVRPRLQCARCLAEFEQELPLEIDETFVPLLDPLTRDPVEAASPEEFRIDEHQHLDLSEAVRQYEQSALPLRPMCRADCAGLCARCGHDLNRGACGCPAERGDGRWTSLATLAERLKTTEDPDGPAQA